MGKERILIVDDNSFTCQFISTLLEGYEYSTKSVGTISLALDALSLESFQVVISDIYFQFGMDGIEFIHRLSEKYPPVKIIIVSGRLNLSTKGIIELSQNKSLLCFMNKSADLTVILPKCLENYFSSK